MSFYREQTPCLILRLHENFCSVDCPSPSWLFVSASEKLHSNYCSIVLIIMIQCCGIIQHPCIYLPDLCQTSDRDTQSQCSTNVDRETLNTTQGGDNCDLTRSQDTCTEMEADGVTETGTDDITSPAVPHDNKSKQKRLKHSFLLTVIKFKCF